MKRIFPDRPILAVGAVVLKNKHILLVKRKRAPDKNLWSIPGGAVKLGESLIKAAKRELKEECNLEVGKGKIVFVIDKIYYTGKNKIIYHYSIIDFLFSDSNGKLQAGSDAESARFFPLKKISDYSDISESTLDALYIFEKNANLPIYESIVSKYPDSKSSV